MKGIQVGLDTPAMREALLQVDQLNRSMVTTLSSKTASELVEAVRRSVQGTPRHTFKRPGVPVYSKPCPEEKKKRKREQKAARKRNRH